MATRGPLAAPGRTVLQTSGYGIPTVPIRKLRFTEATGFIQSKPRQHLLLPCLRTACPHSQGSPSSPGPSSSMATARHPGPLVLAGHIWPTDGFYLAMRCLLYFFNCQHELSGDFIELVLCLLRPLEERLRPACAPAPGRLTPACRRGPAQTKLLQATSQPPIAQALFFREKENCSLWLPQGENRR